MSYPQINNGREGIGLVTGQFYPHSFDLAALETFEAFVGEHSGCMWYSDVAHESEVRTDAIAIRHDVDHSIVHAHRFASWEAERGINASYYILPTAPYYVKEDTLPLALEMQAMGHEIGVHNDAHTSLWRDIVKAGLADKHAPEKIAGMAVQRLYNWASDLRELGVHITGCADHGGGEPHNVDMWKPRGAYVPEDADLRYECYALHARGANYISDNRGTWRSPLVKVEGKQTHVLIHPEHWRLP